MTIQPNLMNIQLKILDDRVGTSIELPKFSTNGSAGMDLRACCSDPLAIQPNATVKIKTGLSIFIKDPNYAGLVLARSGLGTKKGLVPAQMVGLIDSDYQGEVFVVLWNRSDQVQTVEPGERIAQFVLIPVKQFDWTIVSDYNESTNRAAGGFGSTGSQ